MKITRLYSVEIVEGCHSFSRLVACSNDLNKLKAIIHTPDGMIRQVSEANDPTLKMRTKEDVYPLYLFREVPYIV